MATDIHIPSPEAQMLCKAVFDANLSAMRAVPGNIPPAPARYNPKPLTQTSWLLTPLLSIVPADSDSPIARLRVTGTACVFEEDGVTPKDLVLHLDVGTEDEEKFKHWRVPNTATAALPFLLGNWTKVPGVGDELQKRAVELLVSVAAKAHGMKPDETVGMWCQMHVGNAVGIGGFGL